MSAQLQSPVLSGADVITVLHSTGPRLTKVWDAGGIQAYEDARQFRVAEHPVAGIRELHTLLARLESDPQACIVRGRWVGAARSAELFPDERLRPGHTLRRKELFPDRPLRMVLIDVDSYQPMLYDPVAEPEDAAREFILDRLPAAFHRATFHWQLSASAGAPGKEGVLKAHLWFWLAAPRTGAELEAWADTLAPGTVDRAVFRPVQVHYTAAPVVAGGACPVRARSGLWVGAADTVALEIDAASAARASAVRGARTEMVDPRDKPGLVGAFCRAFEPREAIERFLPEHFSFDDEVRITWHGGGGAAGGACVTDDGLHVYNSHNTDPAGGRATNVWDLVRVHRFGHLDAGLDDFERMDIAALPSHRAMAEWVQGLPEVQAETAGHEERDGRGAAERLLALVEAADDAHALEHRVAREIAHAAALDDTGREVLARAIQARVKALAGVAPPIDAVRRWIKPAVAIGGFADMDAEGRPLATLRNFEALVGLMRTTVRYNVIAKRTEILIPGTRFSADNAESAALTMVLSECNRLQMPRASAALVAQMCTLIADRNQFNPVLAWIESAPWDGRSRIEEFLATVESPMDAALKRELMLRWAISAVALAASPRPLEAHGVLTFQGVQGAGKTRWLKSLAPADLGVVQAGVTLDPKDKDSVLRVIRYWLVELGELDATFKKSDIAELKSFATQDTDVVRLPYAAGNSTFQRRTVFFASVNEEEFLHDPTGNRRFWVVPVSAVRSEHDLDIQQFWAEMLALWRAGERWWLDGASQQRLAVHNEEFTVGDPVEDLIAERLDWGAAPDQWRRMAPSDLLRELGLARPTRAESTAAGRALKRRGIESTKSNGVRRSRVPPLRTQGHTPDDDFL